MAGTTNRNVISVQEAKTRLLAAGEKSAASTLARPIIRMGAALLAGAYLGHQLRKPRRDQAASSVAILLRHVTSAVAPLLVEQIIRAVTGDTTSAKDDESPA